MAKSKARRRNGRGNGGFTLPLAVVAGFAPLAIGTMQTAGGWDRKLWYMTQALTGYDTDTKRFWMQNLNKGLLPIAIGFLAHWILGQKMGMNRMLKNSGIPIVRI